MIIQIYCTFPDKLSAIDICSNLIKNKLIACSNIVSPVESLYEWEGQFCKDNECIVLLKTNKDKILECVAYIEKHHPYECPLILWKECFVNQKYQFWLEEQLN